MTSEPPPFDTGTDTLLVESSGGVATITFNRPDKHNALSVETQSALPATLSYVDSDPTVRVLVLRCAPRPSARRESPGHAEPSIRR